jgi:mono/diheme cytochrome c family protein
MNHWIPSFARLLSWKRHGASGLCAAFMLLGIANTLAVANTLTPAPATTTQPARASKTDPVAELQQRIDRGDAGLTFDTRHGWLESVLRELRVPIDSQGLVFSKTSFQPDHISPRTPRAIYFNDDVYIGWVQGGKVLEVAAVDPQNGAAFYALSQKNQRRPRFIREDSSCMQCHQSEATGGLPGFLMRSVYPDAQGMPVLSAGTYLTTDRSPFNERWGGWYMDGKTKDLGMGNGIVNDLDRPDNLARTPTKLSMAFDTAPYLSAHSDVVALMVLAHQTRLHNLLARAGDETMRALRDEASIRQMLHEETDRHSQTTESRIKSACDPVVEGLLFCGEPALASPVEGSTNFVREFEKRGPRDHRGRSLREFDLHRRLFRYPCSYLIYSGQFSGLPEPAKQYIYRRLWQVLTGRDDSRPFSHLTDAERDAVYQIVRETKAGLPAYWKPRD